VGYLGVDFVGRQLAVFFGFGVLCHFDLDVVGVCEV